VYTSISSGNELTIRGTLTRLTKHLKHDFIKRAWKKQQTAFWKKGAKIHLKNDRKITCPSGLKSRRKIDGEYSRTISSKIDQNAQKSL
jgi:hypothetical protein